MRGCAIRIGHGGGRAHTEKREHAATLGALSLPSAIAVGAGAGRAAGVDFPTRAVRAAGVSSTMAGGTGDAPRGVAPTAIVGANAVALGAGRVFVRNEGARRAGTQQGQDDREDDRGGSAAHAQPGPGTVKVCTGMGRLLSAAASGTLM